MTGSSATIQSIYRYPVKGLSPDALMQTLLTAGEMVAGDRSYAIENGTSGFDPAAPAHLPKTRFLMLMRDERLAALQTRFDADTNTLSICSGGREVARGNLSTVEGKAVIEAFIASHCAGRLRGYPKILSSPGHSFPDDARKAISIMNLASIAAIEGALGAPVHPLRFRGNIYVIGWPAWHERDLVGRDIAVGQTARMRIVDRIGRCAATDVDPNSGLRDLDIPRALARTFGHVDCGVYAMVTQGGDVAINDVVTALR